MKLALLTSIALLALAAPAAADEATLEGYGGDGALLVGIDDSGPQFGEPAPGRPNADDGNLVAETGPAPAGGTQGATGAPTGPSGGPTPAPGDQPSTTRENRSRDRGGRDRRETRPAEPVDSLTPPLGDPPPAPVERAGDEASASSGAGSPFNGTELALLLAALLGMAVMGASMRKLASAQPRL